MAYALSISTFMWANMRNVNRNMARVTSHDASRVTSTTATCGAAPSNGTLAVIMHLPEFLVIRVTRILNSVGVSVAILGALVVMRLWGLVSPWLLLALLLMRCC